jgi:hypothetical protein
VIRLHDCRHFAVTLMFSHDIPRVETQHAASLQHARSLPAILMTTYAHLARIARYVSNIPGTQDEAARLMDDILTPIPIDLGSKVP